MSPRALSQVLRQLSYKSHPSLIVGIENSDDAAVYKLNDDTAIINTIDFFTPIVDDAYLFGQIAAANALSDIYAMGGQPLLALNIVCYPNCLPPEIMSEILKGGGDKVTEAGAVIAGGHTIEDDEPKYGLAVTGTVHPQKLTTNSSAREGDVLILTKPLGTGIINTAIKGELASQESISEAVNIMCELNNKTAEAMCAAGARACTDITGFGLTGHASEMAEASKISLELHANNIPLISETLKLASMGMIPAGAYNNYEYLKDKIHISKTIDTAMKMTLFDPQTSGGLLIAIKEDKADSLISELHKKGISHAEIIGRVLPRENYLIKII